MQVTLWRVIDELGYVISEGVVTDSVYGNIEVYDESIVCTIYNGEIKHFDVAGYELQTKTVTLSW